MSLKINNSNISQIRINNSNIQLAKINGSIVFEINGEIITLNFNDKTISAISNKDGNYDFYYANDSGIIEGYDKIVSFDLKANKESSYTYLNSFNIAPYGATKIVVCESGTTEILSSSFLPSQFLFDSSIYGNKLYSFGAISDVHIDGDGSDQANAESDFIRALQFLNSNANLVGICGDIATNNGYNELSTFKTLVDENSTIPVYVCRGNHDCRYSIDDWNTYIGQELQYEITYNNDVFIFLSMNSENYADSMLSTTQLEWLETKLETYKNQRVFLFFHIFMNNTCGNINELYPYNVMDDTSTNVQKFTSLMSYYKNVVYFSGHSHLAFDCQRYGANATIFDDGTTCHRVHIPSCARPRETDDDVNTYDYNAGSEGYLVDVYENAIILRGRDFIKGKFLPIANYLIDTSIIQLGEEITNLFGGFTDKTSTTGGVTTVWEGTTVTANGTCSTTKNVISDKFTMDLTIGTTYNFTADLISGSVDASLHDNEACNFTLRGYTDETTYEQIFYKAFSGSDTTKTYSFTLSKEYIAYDVIFRQKSDDIYDNFKINITVLES